MSDPRDTILSIVDGITTTRDDDVTNAPLIFLYSGGPEDLSTLFATYDAIIAIDDARVKSERHNQDVPTYYAGGFPLHVTSIDKYSGGALIVTGTKIQWKIKAALRAIIEANAQVGAYTLRDATEDPNNRWVAGLQIWESLYIVEHKIG